MVVEEDKVQLDLKETPASQGQMVLLENRVQLELKDQEVL